MEMARLMEQMLQMVQVQPQALYPCLEGQWYLLFQQTMLCSVSILFWKQMQVTKVKTNENQKKTRHRASLIQAIVWEQLQAYQGFDSTVEFHMQKRKSYSNFLKLNEKERKERDKGYSKLYHST
ncbi:hypothetical protein MANES_17G059200v8 [Manihot esculenta]|uniref:Uncharacterized protein n=1 Tax=Manihot esculenta TaxID=3983 RepID=A0A2C9U667_MANES|nr:hypothetical protein MANES_17G059200v8 [Manihot esculenta]